MRTVNLGSVFVGLLSAAIMCGCNGGRASSAGTGAGSSASGNTGSTSSGDTGGSGGSGGSGSMNTGPTWGEADPGVTSGPVGQFKAFRTGCGEQIWSRFIPTADFVLLEQQIHAPDGTDSDTQYFDTLEFLKDYKSFWQLSDAGGYGAGQYTFAFKVGDPSNGSVLTHMMTVTADGLYRAPDKFDFAGAFNDPSHGLTIQLTPHFTGSIIKVYLVAKDTECVESSQTLLQAYNVSDGVTTELTQGGNPASGTSHVLVLQGVDNATQYVYYATIDFDMP